MSIRTTYAPAKLVGEKLTHWYDWNAQLGTGGPNPDTLSATPPTAVLETFDGQTPDVDATLGDTTDGVTTFTVGAGGPPGFNLGILLTVTTAGGQILQGRVSVPIRTR